MLAADAQAATRIAASLQPALALVELDLPGVGGLTLLRQLRDAAPHASLPVIVASFLDQRSAAFAHGADAYLHKPVDRTQLLATAAALLATPA